MTDILRVREPESARSMLGRINWSFHPRPPAGRSKAFDCRRYHWYPATFIPEIPYTLIEVLTYPGAVVLDPFAGIGTTFYQALLLGRIPYATEVCTVAVDYMRNLIELFDPGVDLDLIRERLWLLLAEYKPGTDYISSLPADTPVEELMPWFAPVTLNEASFMVQQRLSRHGPEAALLGISISATLSAASRQKRGWGCIADNVRPRTYQNDQPSAIDLVRRHSSSVVSGVKLARASNPQYSSAYERVRGAQTIYHEDARDLKSVPDHSVDIVVTSPPYPNMCDYVNSQRLSYYMAGFAPLPSGSLPDFPNEIGARRRRNRRDALENYLADLSRCNEAIASKLKTGGYACLVMPVFESDSTNNTNRRLVVQKVLANLEEQGLARECELERSVPKRRRQHNFNWATLERERIDVFRKV